MRETRVVEPSSSVIVATFYRFVPIEDPSDLAKRLQTDAREVGLRGTVLVAQEGLNGTLCGARDVLDAWFVRLQADSRFAGIEVRYSNSDPDNAVFHRLKVRVRDEIVALRRPNVDPSTATGQHVGATAWNRLLDDPDVLVIDVRNGYEIEVGSFPRAIDPGTGSFREFPDFVETLLTSPASPASRERPVAMFCTGGIRCEKASAYMLGEGFKHVYQLDGGILNYLEQTADNRFLGECFVFDQRVSVTDELEEGDHVQCHACRRALAPADLESAWYQEGVSCGYCHAGLSQTQRAAFTERRRQVELAAERGDVHVGAEMRAGPAGPDREDTK